MSDRVIQIQIAFRNTLNFEEKISKKNRMKRNGKSDFLNSFFQPDLLHDWFSACGGTVDASTQAKYIMSPGFPGSYPDGLDCVWTITAPQDKKVFAVVEEMDIEYSYDYLYMGRGQYFSFSYQYIPQLSVLERSSWRDPLPEWGRTKIFHGNFHQNSPTEQAVNIIDDEFS